MNRAAIAIGSNVGDRAAHLDAALSRLASLGETTIFRVSPYIETAPVVPEGAESAAGGSYLNAVALIHTPLSPRALLNELLRIEHELGRVRLPQNRWGERSIDLDLLLFDDLVIDEPGLVVPHPRLHLRRFVLDPLAHVAPHWVVPTLGKSVAQLFAALPPPPPEVTANNPA
jgi:2-amino-4-hydroxy-6-hydroxymethyldihydropteridine diphosphokinase